jgi:hypothetical protein
VALIGAPQAPPGQVSPTPERASPARVPPTQKLTLQVYARMDAADEAALPEPVRVKW